MGPPGAGVETPALTFNLKSESETEAPAFPHGRVLINRLAVSAFGQTGHALDGTRDSRQRAQGRQKALPATPYQRAAPCYEARS
jgi:hypothetical protein